MELKGILKQLNPVVERGNYQSRRVWLTTEPESQYPQTVEIELGKDKIDLLNNTQVGAEINCHINLRGREWTSPEGKTSVFNTLSCWKVDGITAKPVQAQPLHTPSTFQHDNNDLPV